MIPKVLMCHVQRPMCAGLMFDAAFRQAGCEVKTIGPAFPQVYGKPSTGGEHTFPEEDYVPPDIPLHDSQRPIHVEFAIEQAQAIGFRPDLVVMVDQFDQWYLTGATDQAKFVWVAVENWNPQQWERAYRQTPSGLSGLRSTDAEFYMIRHDSWGKDVSPPLAKDRHGKEAEWMLFGADQFVHPNYDKPRTRLVCQIGSAYEPRPEIWNALRAEFDGAPPVSQPDYAETYHETTNTVFGRAPSYRTHADLYNSALCAISSSNVDFIPMRTAEAFAMGCVLLSDDVPAMRAAYDAPFAADDGEQVTVEDSEGIWIAHRRDAASIARCIRYAEKYDMTELRNRATVAVHAEHLYYHRALRILEAVGLQGACRMV